MHMALRYSPHTSPPWCASLLDAFPSYFVFHSTGHWHCVGRLPDAHSAEVYTLDCAPSRAGHGRIASGGGDNRIQIYREDMGSTSDEPKFALDTVVSTSHGDVNCVCWHPWDGSVLCSAGDDGKVQLWSYQQS
mmetsp:Transcript_6695/g.18192  ORF Transcript_6695/g.18192 Transcript_6695/m.18192 type:complete len:133 (-) Transcript_6695:1398-1796(-)